jgi:hypothetical protein
MSQSNTLTGLDLEELLTPQDGQAGGTKDSPKRRQIPRQNPRVKQEARLGRIIIQRPAGTLLLC